MHLKIEKYEVKNSLLKQFVNFFWTINSTDSDINHKFWPIRNIDLIINLSSNVKCATADNQEKKLSNVYFMGILDEYKYNWILQKGNLEIIGISFSSIGLYPFIKIPLSEFKNEIIDFEMLNSDFSNMIVDKLQQNSNTQDKLDLIEKALLDLLDSKYFVPKNYAQVITNFNSINGQLNIEQHCNKYGISNRQLERLFDKYVGINPKTHFRISRFQNTINQALKDNFNKLSDLAYDNGYYDQMHFTREFKAFTGAIPSQFINRKTSLKEISYFS